MNEPYYSDDLVTLYHGDCLERLEWNCADVLVTDPPYGISVESKKGKYLGPSSQLRSRNVISGDSSVEVRDAALHVWGRSKPQVVFGTWRMPRPTRVDHRLIWHKAGGAPGAANMPFMLQDEEIYIAGNGFVSSSPPMRSVITTRESRSAEVTRVGHPTPKPIGLMEVLIGRCPPGVIADPFAGSGATLVAARNLSRKVIGVELEERYCELIAKRLSQQAFDFGELA